MRYLTFSFLVSFLMIASFGCGPKSTSRGDGEGGEDISSGGSGGDDQAVGGLNGGVGGSGGDGGIQEMCPSDILDCDEDGVSVVDGDCDDDDPDRFPGNVDTCNGIDNNCSGDESDACSSVGCDEVNIASLISASSSCLTSGSGAQLVVQVELRTQEGARIEDGQVHFVSNQRGIHISESQRNGDAFYAVVTASSGVAVDASSDLEISAIAACGGNTEVAFENVLTVSRAQSVSETGTLVTGGCSPLDGNVRVRVRDAESGMPLQSASVMVGDAENDSAFFRDATAWIEDNQEAKEPNVMQTDPQGQVLIKDFANALSGELDVSVAADGYDNVTVLSSSASDIVVSLRRLDTVLPERQEFIGQIQGQQQGANGDSILSLGAVLPSLPLRNWPTFLGVDLVPEFQCWTPRPEEAPGTFFFVQNMLFVPAQEGSIRLFDIDVTRPFHFILPNSAVPTSLAVFGEFDIGNSLEAIAEGGTEALLIFLRTLDVQHGAGFDPMNVADPNHVTVQVGAGPDQVGRCQIQNLPNIPQGLSASCAGFWSVDTVGDQEYVLPSGFGAITHEEFEELDQMNVDIDVNMFSSLEGIPNENPMAVAMLTDTSLTDNGSWDQRSSSIIQRGGFVDAGNGDLQMQADDFLYPMVNYRLRVDGQGNPIWLMWDNPESAALNSAEVSYCELTVEAMLRHTENEFCGPEGNEMEEDEWVHRIPLHRFYFDEDTTQIPAFSRPESWHQLDEQTLEQLYQMLNLNEEETYDMYFYSTISCHAHTDRPEFDLNNQVLDEWFNNYSHLSLSKRFFPKLVFPPEDASEE